MRNVSSAMNIKIEDKFTNVHKQNTFIIQHQLLIVVIYSNIVSVKLKGFLLNYFPQSSLLIHHRLYSCESLLHLSSYYMMNHFN